MPVKTWMTFFNVKMFRFLFYILLASNYQITNCWASVFSVLFIFRRKTIKLSLVLVWCVRCVLFRFRHFISFRHCSVHVLRFLSRQAKIIMSVLLQSFQFLMCRSFIPRLSSLNEQNSYVLFCFGIQWYVWISFATGRRYVTW